MLHVLRYLLWERERKWGEGRKGWGFQEGICPLRLCYSRSIIDWLVVWQEALQKIRQKNTMRREVTVELSSQGFWKTGIRSDVCQVTSVKCIHTHTLKNTWMQIYNCTPKTLSEILKFTLPVDLHCTYRHTHTRTRTRRWATVRHSPCDLSTHCVTFTFKCQSQCEESGLPTVPKQP